MKKPLLCAAAGLLLLCSTGALADTPAYIMTREEMEAVYQRSHQRMNTSGWFDIITLDELPVDSHAQRITSLPMEGDLPYDEALRLAKTTLHDKYGVSMEELDAMGVYPRLLDYVQQDAQSEWEFFFTPVRDIDFRLKHELPVGGEYLAVLGARTGETLEVKWYSGGLAEQILEEIAWEAALLRSEMSPQAFAEAFAPAYVHHYDREKGVCLAFVYSRTADQPGGDNHVYQVLIDYRRGDVVGIEYTDGVG